MYIRFLTPQPAWRGHAAGIGIFRPAHKYWADRHNPCWLRRALRDELDWFNENLAFPGRLGVSTRKSRRSHAGLCWFRDSAQDCIAHAHTLSGLLGECGVAVTKVVSDNPGDIVYRDAQQIVAMPRADSPVVWH